MFRFIPYLFCVLFVTSCATQQPEPPENTQLEIRQIQTREFPTDDLRLVMKSVLNVLQDENFIVKNVAMDLGFLTATKEVDIENPNSPFWAKFQRSDGARWEKYEIIEATVSVSEFGKGVRVRANFQSKIMDNRGAVVSVRQLTDGPFYQDFFSKVDKGLFIEKQNI